MDRAALIKKMLIGLVPLVAFIIADEVFGTETGLVVAIIIGIGQLVWFYVKDRKIEKFILIDTGLIVALGGVSLISHNDLFFKIKPALIKFILVIILGISAFSSKNIVLAMQKRYTGDIALNNSQMDQIRRSLKLMFYVMLAHSLLILYAAFYMSTEAWGFISTALFYIIVGVIFLWQLVSNKLKARHTEWLPVIDKDGKVIGKAPREVCKKDKSLIYPVVRLHIFNPQKQIFLQKRTMNTSIQPGKYDAAVAGHVRFGETVEDAVRREAREELNLSGFDFFQVDRTMFYGETTTAMMFIFVAVVDGEIKPDAKETAGGGFFDFKTARRQIGEENLSAGLKEEWPLLVKIYNNMKIKKHNK